MRSFVAVALLLLVGCSKAVEQDKPLLLDAVPEVVMKAAEAAAKKSFPDLKFQTATLKRTGVYEITGKTKNGKVHDVEVKPDGEVVEVE